MWSSIILLIGISLFEAKQEIQTVWDNNYGDLAFHLGMISSFVFGDNFPPQYHIFAGETLSYPFFTNLWSAMLWWPYATFRMLSIIALYQWCIIWTMLFVLLEPKKYPLLPWAVLFGGGTFAYAYLVVTNPELAGGQSGHVMDKGYPWSSFLSCIWVPQRSSNLGLLSMLSALTLFGCSRREQGFDRLMLILCGLTLGLSVLAHVHFTLVSGLFIGSILLLDLLKDRERAASERWHDLLCFGSASLTAFAFLPWLLGKSGIAQLQIGWKPWPNEFEHEAVSRLVGMFQMWGFNIPILLIVFATLFLWGKNKLPWAIIGALFVLGNFVILARWEWDQIKIFAALYIILIWQWSQLNSRFARRLQIAALLLCIPSLVEFGRLVINYRYHTVYSRDSVQLSYRVREIVPKQAVLAGRADHNSPLTLTGRKLFSGFGPVLFSHALDYRPREKIQENLEELLTCAEKHPEMPCPEYFLWTKREREGWKGSPHGDQRATRTSVPGLYRVVR